MAKTTAREYAARHRIPLERFETEQFELDDPMTEAALRRHIAFADEVDADELRESMEAVTYYEAELRSAKAELCKTVAMVLKDGYSATKAAKVLGVSRARVYQLRDGKR